MNKRVITAGAVALTLVAAACGSDAEDAVDDVTDAAEDAADDVADAAEDAADDAMDEAEEAMDDAEDAVDDAMDDDAMGDGATEAAVSCDAPLTTDGVLTVATGETVFPPWMGAGEDDFDDPTTGTGYEGALVFALAEQLGFGPDQVEFVRTGFDEVIAPGEKDWDFNIQQYTITEQRDEVVDFSDGYYSAKQAIIGAADGPAAAATSVAELQDLRIGAAIGTTSLDYAETVIAPSSDVLVFDDNAAAKAAFDSGQVDAIVFDVPTAFFVTAVEITDAAIIGVLPEGGEADELGMLFEEGNPLVGCVNEALANLEADGSLAAFEQEWLSQGGDIPTLSQ
ncbi:MAG: ABC transporter substrate-binding protein [Actinomycetota bacterium]